MTETPNEAFERIRDTRLPKAIKAIELLGNLGASRYKATEAQKRDITDQLFDAVDAVADEYGLPPADEGGPLPDDCLPARETSDDEDDDVNRTIMGDVRWALEMLDRDPAEAKLLLKRAVERHWDLHGKD